MILRELAELRRRKRGKSGGKNLRLNVTSKFEMLEARERERRMRVK